MMNVSRIAAPTPPELEFWRGRSLQTPTGPMDRDFGSSLSLQDKLVELPSTSSSLHGPHFEPPQTPNCPELAPTKLRNNLDTESTKLSKPGICNQCMNLRLVRRNARSA